MGITKTPWGCLEGRGAWDGGAGAGSGTLVSHVEDVQYVLVYWLLFTAVLFSPLQKGVLNMCMCLSEYVLLTAPFRSIKMSDLIHVICITLCLIEHCYTEGYRGVLLIMYIVWIDAFITGVRFKHDVFWIDT